MPNTVWPSIHAKVLRLTKLDACGVPITGVANKSMLVSAGLVKVSITAEYEEGEDTVQKNGNGDICFQHKDPDQIKYLSTEVQFCGVDPEAWSMITGQPLVLDAEGNAVGLRLSSRPLEARVGLEVWTDVPGQACAGGQQPFGYFCLPFLGSGRVGDLELAVSAAEFTLTSQTKPGTGWGVGPYNVVRDDTDAAAPLADALTATDHAILLQTTVAPPAPTNGAVLLPTPSGP